MAITTTNIKTWKKLEDDTMELVSDINVEVDEPSKEELIKQKEALLLQMYEELESLKQK
jgi:hypothetical protein|tara:strand:+ start:582 stop:758 length:177 start_codon:yes stop_codon:yes gene_type:complete